MDILSLDIDATIPGKGVYMGRTVPAPSKSQAGIANLARKNLKNALNHLHAYKIALNGLADLDARIGISCSNDGIFRIGDTVTDRESVLEMRGETYNAAVELRNLFRNAEREVLSLLPDMRKRGLSVSTKLKSFCENDIEADLRKVIFERTSSLNAE